MKYVLVTPTKDEEAFIGSTIDSVVSQTIPPAEWIIVSDGSTDRTEALVRDASNSCPWIRLLPLAPRRDRDFTAVVRATETGIRALRTQDYDYIGLLDSDVRFQSDYFEKVIDCFVSSPRLGLAGGVVVDVGTTHGRLPTNRLDVPGAVQFFRRCCFEDLEGLLAIPEGGWDALTCARARMRGYETRLLTDIFVDHLKPRNISEGSILRRRWQMGIRDYALGYDPVFELVKCLGRMLDHPHLVGGAAWLLGYCSGFVGRIERRVPDDLLQFIRIEQRARLRRTFQASFSG